MGCVLRDKTTWRRIRRSQQHEWKDGLTYFETLHSLPNERASFDSVTHGKCFTCKRAVNFPRGRGWPRATFSRVNRALKLALRHQTLTKLTAGFGLQAFSSLSEAAFEAAQTNEEEDDPATYCLSKYFPEIVQKLLDVANRWAKGRSSSQLSKAPETKPIKVVVGIDFLLFAVDMWSVTW